MPECDVDVHAFPLVSGTSAAQWTGLSGKKLQETLTDLRFCVNYNYLREAIGC